MTRILKLEMRGFKSFAKLTTLNFSSNFNVIIGPNGAGKSNVFDALCFVLGKSSMKDIRAERAASLIYNGGKSKKPSSEAEVSIYFDNRDNSFPIDSEVIKLTRIVKQDGKSVYKINNKTRSRREILELLNHAHINPDGYNIVLQGDVTKVVEMTPNERRGIIEEVAGIRIYEEKKQKALNELQKVEETLKDAELILSEREERLKELEVEKNQALRYLELQKSIKKYRASIIRQDLIQIEKKLNQVNSTIEKYNEKIEEYKKQIEELNKERNNYLNEISEITKSIEERSNFGESEIKTRLDELKIEYEKKKLLIENYEKEYQNLILKKGQLEKSINEINNKILLAKKEVEDLQKHKQKLDNEVNNLRKKIETIKEKYNLNDLSDYDKKLEEIEKHIEELNLKSDSLKKEQQELIRKRDQLEYQINNIRSRKLQLQEKLKEIEEMKKKLKELKDQFKKISVELNKKLDLDTKYSKELANARENYLKTENELARLRSKLDIKTQNLATQNILKIIKDLKRTVPGIYGSVLELGSTKEEYALALEIAGASRINGIVVENEDVAITIIKHLKDKKIGTALLFPLNKIKPPKLENLSKYMKIDGVIGTALDLIEYDAKFDNVFKYVFANTLIIRNVDVAKRIGVGKVRMVTLDGDLFETSGAIHGGFRQKKSSGFVDSTIKNKIQKLESDLENYDIVMRELENKKKENLNEIYELRKQKADLEAEIIKIQKLIVEPVEELDDESLKDELKNVDEKLEMINEELMTIMQEIMQSKMEKQKIRQLLVKARSPEIMAELQAYEDQLREVSEEIIRVEEKLNHSQQHLKNVLMQDLEETEKLLYDTDKQIKNIEKAKKDVNDELIELESEIEELKEHEMELYAEFKELFNKRNNLESLVREIEDKIIEFENSIRELEQKINLINLESADSKARYEALKEHLKEYDVDEYIDAPKSKLKNTLESLEKEFNSFSSVNLKAIEDYEQLKVKIDELKKKKEDLEKEKSEVLLLMNEIETKKKEEFLKTFNQINENFKRIFAELMPKGEAYLMLEDEKNIFENGLRIVVRLTTKRFIDIRSLSGGEKTMTALAFIFAIQEYQPSPFYIFDEVDAALDKKNTKMLVNYIHKYSKEAQYIVVSHNDALIVEANTIFGVSMNSEGISTVVALKLNDEVISDDLKRELKKLNKKQTQKVENQKG